MEFKILINNEDVTDFVPFPLSSQFSLDESLDVGHLNLQYTNIAEPFKPFTSCDIFIDDAEYNFFISSDEVTEVIQNGVYNHSLLLIEQSKWLERFTGIVKTNTTPIVKDYSDIQSVPVPIMAEVDEREQQIELSGKPLTAADLQIYPFSEMWVTPTKNTVLPVLSWRSLLEGITGKNYDDVTGVNFVKFRYIENDEIKKEVTDQSLIPDEIIISPNAQARIEYHRTATSGPITLTGIVSLTTNNMTVAEAVEENTITSVVNDLLATCESILETETPRFTFNEEQAAKYASVKAPDFSLTGTLWECLSQIGSYIHCIPRLKNNVIYFDELGRKEITDINLEDYCSNVQKVDIEQYVSTLDSSLNNMVNVDNKEQGTIIAPFSLGYKTVRTESGVVQIKEDNIFIETREPIEEIVKVECGYISNGTKVGDITRYVFESAEYDTLSAIGKEFPASKGYALKYTQGQRNITQLNFKLENAVSSVFERYSIINIIAHKLGVDANSLSNEDITNLQFRVTYIPIVSARFKQVKSNYEDITTMSMLSFQQSANKVNSVAYGENMKGTIAKLGNPEVVKVFIDNDLNHIPKVGEKFNKDYYISLVKVEHYKDFYKCEIALSKNYNKLNEYVGINSQKRFYEISEKESVDRYIVHEDYCVIGSPIEGDKKALIAEDAKSNFYGTEKFLFQFMKDAEFYFPFEIDMAVVQGYDKYGNALQGVVLPVLSLSMGNSIVLNFHYDDNYSAGTRRPNTSATKLQKQTRYTDLNGEIETLAIAFGNGKTSITDYRSAVLEGNSLPTKEIVDVGIHTYITTDKVGKVLIKKDNRENISFTYQLHFLTNNKSYVIGTALSRRSSFITNISRKCKLYGLTEELAPFTSFVDLTNATLLTDDIKGNYGSDYVELNIPESAKNYVAWAIVTKEDELMIGQNVDESFSTAVRFTFTHKIA